LPDEFTKTRVLITVMTYPLPSRNHLELVCTAGITDSNEWVRLYPIDYRYRPTGQKFHKYQWVEIELAARGRGNDDRKESRKPNLDSIDPLGEPLSTRNNWRDRKRIIENLPINTINELKALYEVDKTSLGIVRPSQIIDLKIEDASRDWKPEWQNLYDQLRLFGPTPKPLTKIPYKFSYVFECHDSETAHSAMIEDWELGVLYLKELNRLGNEGQAAENVKRKFFDEMCAPNKDTLFFMGTTFPFNSWVVLGVFWPQKDNQLTLNF